MFIFSGFILYFRVLDLVYTHIFVVVCFLIFTFFTFKFSELVTGRITPPVKTVINVVCGSEGFSLLEF